jgi:hypothetical protein
MKLSAVRKILITGPSCVKIAGKPKEVLRKLHQKVWSHFSRSTVQQ